MTWRYRIWKFGGNVLRRLKLYSAVCWMLWQMRRVKNKLLRQIGVMNTAIRAMLHMAVLSDEEPPHAYDVICLPVIPWKSRFQRPQQLMAQAADRGHRVFYASLGFHGGADAMQKTLQPGVWEISLPGSRGTNVYKQLPTDADVEAMAAAIDRLRIERRVTSAVVVVQLPFWTALAEQLRERFGWPIVYDCMDDHAGFSTNCEAMLQTEERTIAESDLVIVTSDVLEQKVCRKAKRAAMVRNACDYEHFAAVSESRVGQAQRSPTTDDSKEELSDNNQSHAKAQRRKDFIKEDASKITVETHKNRNHFLSVFLAPLRLCVRFFTSKTVQSHFVPKNIPSEDKIEEEHGGTALRLSHPTMIAPTSTTIGFYGAIAEWFDADLVADLAELRPEWRFELIGSTFTGDVSRLEKLPNVALLGEKPYAELPRLIAHWACFLIPFRRIPLTEATNPVKAYEMLATGIPVVAVDLPELRPMARDGLLSLADDAHEFAAAIERERAEDNTQQQSRRRAFAAQNTWGDRYDAFDAATRDLFPLASILIVCYNNLALTKACLESIFRETEYPNYEVIVVDNASSDGTAGWLAEQAAREPRLRVIINAENRGFAGGNNAALHAARGHYLCLLNNDTVVAPGWLSTLIRRLDVSPRLGMVGPVSNMVGNSAIVPVSYRRISGMRRWAGNYCRRHAGESVAMTMLGFFCVAMRRDVYEKVGDLDEQFGLGYFEDDDYCRRVVAEGFEMCFVRDAFVHHCQGASFKLLGKAAHQEVFERNRIKYEEKWRGADQSSSKERAA